MPDNGDINFVHTGPGTVAGRFLRTFWQPVYRVQDLPAGQAFPIRIMGENFTLYRGESGNAHVVAFRCAHRATQLSTGWVEGDCIRCMYHGWKYDASGQCVEQPGQEGDFASKVRIRSYPTKEYLGLIFAYLGEGEAPPLRRYPDMETEGVLEVYAAEEWPCNYFNRIDNACDQAHVAFTHRESRVVVNEFNPVPKLAARETDYGIETSVTEPGRSTYSMHFIMPNTNHFRATISVRDPQAPKGMINRLIWRVPVDDENCVSFTMDLANLTGEAAETYRSRRQQMVQATGTPADQLGAKVLAGKLRISDIRNQGNPRNLTSLEDYVAQVGQGTIADRSDERLAKTDVGVILLRKIWERELRALAEGRPLKQWVIPEVFPLTRFID